jgi:hypothetical protein
LTSTSSQQKSLFGDGDSDHLSGCLRLSDIQLREPHLFGKAPLEVTQRLDLACSRDQLIALSQYRLSQGLAQSF